MNDAAPLNPDEMLLWQSLGRLVHALPREPTVAGVLRALTEATLRERA